MRAETSLTTRSSTYWQFHKKSRYIRSPCHLRRISFVIYLSLKLKLDKVNKMQNKETNDCLEIIQIRRKRNHFHSSYHLVKKISGRKPAEGHIAGNATCSKSDTKFVMNITVNATTVCI